MRKITLALALATTAVFIAPTSQARPVEGDVARHCVSLLVAHGPARHGVLRMTTRQLGCSASFPRAIRVATHGAIRLPAWVTPASITDAVIASSTDHLGGPVPVGTEYNGLDYAGSSQTYLGATTCQDETIDVTNLPAGEDDVYESGKGFGGCDHNKKFAGPWLAGDSVTCTPNCTGYGSLRNEVSSLRYRP